VSENDPINLTQLAKAMGYSRSTIYAWVAAGYEPEFGHRTTIAHAKHWLREIYAPMIHAKRRERRAEQARLLEEMA
jgi:predicted DNA-binding transcriptional regulator AlpA